MYATYTIIELAVYKMRINHIMSKDKRSMMKFFVVVNDLMDNFPYTDLEGNHMFIPFGKNGDCKQCINTNTSINMDLKHKSTSVKSLKLKRQF